MRQVLISAIIAGVLLSASASAQTSKSDTQKAQKFFGNMMDPYFNEEDTNHDGRLSRSEMLASGEAQFQQQDANHDGKVSREEIYAWGLKQQQKAQDKLMNDPNFMPNTMKAMGVSANSPEMQQMEKMQKAMQQDPHIKAQMQKIMQQAQQQAAKDPKAAADIPLDEMGDANRDGFITHDEAVAMFDKSFPQIDTNGDGYASKDELSAYAVKRMQQAQQKIQSTHGAMPSMNGAYPPVSQ